MEKTAEHHTAAAARQTRMLVMTALFAALGYFHIQAIFIDFFSGLLKGLLGYGFWLMPPALLLAAYILAFHRGRVTPARSHGSVLREAKLLTQHPGFKGYIHDVGGPSATFRHPSCEKQLKHGLCKNRACLAPEACPNLNADHTDYMMLLRKLRAIPGIKKVFIRSGIRFDYLIYDNDRTFLRELCEHHVSGQLKVAPEHSSDAVLEKMGKPGVDVYNRFVKAYKDMNEKIGKKQYLVPYLMSSHPGSTLKEAVELAEFLRDLGYMPEQVQDFYPTPSTISTCMYYTGVDPRNMQPIYVAVNPHEKAMQRALIQYRNPKNYDLVYEALVKAGRTDLIGFDKKCLIRPRQGEYQNHGERNMRHDGKKGRTDQKPAKKKTIRNVHNKKASGTNMNKSAKNRADHSNPQRSVRKKK